MKTQICKVKGKRSLLDELLMSIVQETGILGTLKDDGDKTILTFKVDSENQLEDIEEIIGDLGLEVDIKDAPDNTIRVGVNGEGNLYKKN